MPATPTPEFLRLQAAVAGRYSLVRELGRGGMGVVFLARDVALDRLVAIKLLPPELAARPELRDRFLREARTAARLSHPHIVSIYAVEEIGPLVFFVMAFVDGETLGQRVRVQGPRPPTEVMRMVQEVAWALGHAHANGVVHRDVKPDNILIERETGRALVADFGIARRAAGGDTPSGGLMGTPQYMAPEQALGKSVDGRTDLYALGVTAFYSLTGRLPFESASVAGLLAQHAGEPPPPVLSVAPRAGTRFAAALDRLLQKDPAQRYPSADELAEAVRASRGAVAEVPPAIRAFLREVEGAGGEIAFFTSIGVGSLLVYRLFFWGGFFNGMVFYPVAALMFGLGGARLGQVFGKVRDLVRQGYDHARVRPIIMAELEHQAEEQAVDSAARRGIVRDTVFAMLIGAVKTGACIWLSRRNGPFWINFLGAVGTVMIPAAAVRQIWGLLRRGRPGIWLRWLSRGVGRLLFRAARLGIKAPALPPESTEPTELALGGELGGLYARLPAELRRRFSGLPALIDRLQADAQALRIKEDGRSGHRLGDAVAALEALRLDLLRLHAGAAVQEELTRDLEAAKRVGDAIDAAMGEG